MYEKIKLIGGVEVVVNLNNPSKCKNCKKIIWWGVTKKPANIPISKDKSGNFISHSVDCPYADNFGKKLAGEGDRVDAIEIQNKRNKWAR